LELFLYFCKFDLTSGSSPTLNTYGVNYICVGGVNSTIPNLERVSRVLDRSPLNAIEVANKGTLPICSLPAAPSEIPAPSPTYFDSGATYLNGFALHALLIVLLSM
jgi:hypothetical protein